MSSENTTTELEINVKGMACEGCAETVGKAAGSVPGVTEALVDLAAGTVAVKGAQGAFQRQQVVEAIKAAGYAAS